MRRALANAAAAAARSSGAIAVVEQQQQQSTSPLAAAAAVARVLMRATHAARVTSLIAQQYCFGAAGSSPSSPARAFSSGASHSSSSSPSTRSNDNDPTTKSDTFDIRITLRAYDLRFLEEAACAVQDLVLINLSPKPARDLLGTASDGAARAALRDGHGVAFPCLGAATPPKQRTLYSLIRSPHKYKTSFEQFERVAHRRVVSASTRDHDEVQWLLACLRFYQFTGVEVEVAVTSAPTYLLPGLAVEAGVASAGGNGSSSSAFAAHRARFAALFDDAAAALAVSDEGNEGAATNTDLERQREVVGAALKGLREALSGGGGGGAEASAAAASSSSSKPQHPLLAAVDRVLGGLDVDALVREELDRRRGKAAGSVAVAAAAPSAAAAAPLSLLSIPPDLLTKTRAAEQPNESAASSTSSTNEPTAADWLYAAMEEQKKQQQQQAPLPPLPAVVDERAALAAAREQYARFAAALQVALLRGWAARVEGA
jgi:ribosomal protein S10